MDNKDRDEYYVSKIIKDLNFLIEHTHKLKEDDFNKDEVLLDSILFRLIQISENIKNISLELKSKNTQIPWINIVGFRNKIVHDYGKVDLTVVYYVISKSIYELKSFFENIIQ